MTPEEIKAGHTYELTSGDEWTVLRRDGNLLRIKSPLGGEFGDYASNFARYAVRDITPAPEPDQGEKVSQAQGRVASRGNVGTAIPWTTLKNISLDLINCRGLPDPKEPWKPLGKKWVQQHRLESVRMGNAIAAAVAEIRKRQKDAPPATDAVKDELVMVLEGFIETVERVDPGVYRDQIDDARAAIARAEAGTPSHPRFRHKRTGDIYELLLIANEHAERTAQYPPTAVYRRLSDRTVWSRPVQDWGKDFEEVTGNE